MELSTPTVDIISDLISMRLDDMTIAGREDLSQVIALRRALAEIRGLDAVAAGYLKSNQSFSNRGRRRKVSTMISEHV